MIATVVSAAVLGTMNVRRCLVRNSYMLTVGKNIRVGVDPFAIVITSDGKTAYVLNPAEGVPGKGTVTPISIATTATNTVGKPIETGLQPVAIAITTGHQQR